MFSKKYTVKGTHTLRKNDCGKLRSRVSVLMGEKFEGCVDTLFDRKSIVFEQVWAFGSGVKASLFLVDNIPYFVEVNSLSSFQESQDGAAKQNENVLFPTIFLFLKFQSLFAVSNSKNPLDGAGSIVVCRGPTSRYLISGAHLMVPGVVAKQLSTIRLGFIFSVGTKIPYAVGYVTQNLIDNHSSGVGVYILHCYRDSLWNAFAVDFTTNSALVSGAGNALPSEFTDKEVLENLESEEKEIPDAPPEKITKHVDPEITNEFTLSEVERAHFCLMETIKMISPTMLPMKVSHFMSLFSGNYPRDSASAKPIDFKDTPEKKPLAFLQSKDWIAIEEQSKGVHWIAKITRRGALIRDHDSLFHSFIETVHIPRVEEERLEMEQKAILCDKLIYEQKLLSANVLLKPKKEVNRSLAYALLLGTTPDDSAMFPSLESLQDTARIAVQPQLETELIEAMNKLYDQKQIIDNANRYINDKALLVVNKEDPKSLPIVKLEGAMAALIKGSSSIPVNKVGDACLTMFTRMYEISVQTNIKGLECSNSIPPKRILKEGILPVVTLQIERRANKKVTIVKNLEALGFILHVLCVKWKQLYSTSCIIVDPDVKGSGKGGKKHPREIHLQGTFINELKDHLITDLGVLSTMIVCKNAIGYEFEIGMKIFGWTLLGMVASSWCRPRQEPMECFTSKSPFSTGEYRSFKLLSFSDESHDTRVFRFALPEADMPLNLTPACCVTFRYQGKNGEEVVRPYTPISRSDQKGYFEVLVKNYKGSKMGQHLFEMRQGDVIEAKGPYVKLGLRPNQYKTIGMIAGGTGIAPMYQVARHVLSNPKNTTEISLLYSNKHKEDVLLGNELNDLMRNFPKFSPYFILSHATRDWMGGVGHINKDVIKALMPPPQQAASAIILVCGPPPFMESISGDKDYRKSPPGQGDLRGCLRELGYLPSMIFKL